MQLGSLAAWLVLASVAAGCSEPSLALPRADSGTIAVELGPQVDAERAPRLFRARLDGAGASSVPWLFRGELSTYHQRAVRRGEVPATLRQRAVPVRFWRDGGSLWVQPLALLDRGERYALALTGHGSARSFETSDVDAPAVERLFPPTGQVPARISVLCGAPSADTISDLMLEPGRTKVMTTPGVGGLPREGCVTLEVSAPLPTSAVLPPDLNGVLSDPSPFRDEAEPTPPSLATCFRGVATSKGCVEADDDRLWVTATVDSLWVLHQPEARGLVAPAGARTELLRGLAPGSNVHVVGQALDRFGARTPIELSLTTARARRHVVLNEVLANPRGAEATSEWIELINDSDQAATLAGLWLEDGGGSVPLPRELLAAHEIVLLAAKGGLRSSGLDVALPAQTRVIELPSLGTRGLANGGEALLLVGPEGVISRFPQVAATEAGRSLARRHPSSADNLASEFAAHGAPGASPGAPNHFD